MPTANALREADWNAPRMPGLLAPSFFVKPFTSGRSIPSPTAREYYEQQRAKGKLHNNWRSNGFASYFAAGRKQTL
jgi:hypothetical protein